MKAYRSRYAELQKLNAQILAISTDGTDKQSKFRDKMEATWPFIADPDGSKLVALYDVKTPVVNLAQRSTFVIGQDGKIVAVQTGGDAIDVGQAIAALGG